MLRDPKAFSVHKAWSLKWNSRHQDTSCRELGAGNELASLDGDRSENLKCPAKHRIYFRDNDESLQVFEKDVSWPKLHFRAIMLPAVQKIFIITINQFYIRGHRKIETLLQDRTAERWPGWSLNWEGLNPERVPQPPALQLQFSSPLPPSVPLQHPTPWSALNTDRTRKLPVTNIGVILKHSKRLFSHFKI